MRYIIIILSLFLITCGGGGGGGSPTEPVGPTEPTAPTVEDILLTTNEDVPSVIDLKGTDPANLPLTFTISSQPNNGSFVLSGNAGTYTPNANYNGSDELQYIASNGSKSSNIGTVTITVNAVNDDPESIDVSVSTNEDHSIDITLQANEYDGDEIVFQIDEQVSNGTLSLSGNVASYTPNTNWYGVDTFKFSVYDASAKSILRSGNGTIAVNAVNDPPTVNDIYDVEVQIGNVKPIKLNASDVDSYSVSYEIADFPSNGTVTVSNDTAYFSPLSIGADSFTFQAYDGTDYSSVGSVFIDVYSGQFDGVQISSFIGHDHNKWMNGTDIVATVLNNGNYLIAFSAFDSSGYDPMTGLPTDVSYEPIHLIETNSIGQVVNRVILSGLSVPSAEIYAIKQLSNDEIILIASYYDGVTNVYMHRLSSTYDIISEDLTPSAYLTSGYSKYERVSYRRIIELSNGNIFYLGRIYDSNLNEVGEEFDRWSLYDNDLFYSYREPYDGNNYQNEIEVRDINGSVTNTISFDSNPLIQLYGFKKTSYGFLGFGSISWENKTFRFDNNFTVLSYSASPVNSFDKYHVFDEDENGFAVWGDGYTNGGQFKRLDENGNLLYTNNHSTSFDHLTKDDDENFVVFSAGSNQPYEHRNNQVHNFNSSNGWWNQSGSGRQLYIRQFTNQGNRTF